MEQVYTATGGGTREERRQMRDGMLDAARGPMGFEAKARKVFGHAPSATVVRQLLFWEGKKCADPEGYVYITYRQWWDEEGLTRTNMDTARYKLGDEGFGVLEEDPRGLFNRLHYRLKLERLREVMFPELNGPPAEDPVPEHQTLNHDFTVQGSDGLECRVPVVQSAGMRPSHDRDHAKKHNKEISLRAKAPGEDQNKAGAVRDSATTSSPHEERNVPSTKPAGQGLIQNLTRDLAAAGYELPDALKGKYGKIASNLVAKGTKLEEMDLIVARIVARWPEKRLAPNEALRELRDERDGTTGAGSPPEAVRAIRENARYGERGRSKGLELWKVAEIFNLTSEADPPRRVFNRLGGESPTTFGTGAEIERQSNLASLRSIARRAVREAQVAELQPSGEVAAEDTAARIDSKSPEEAPEGYDTSEPAQGSGAMLQTAQRVAEDPDHPAHRLARAMVEEKSSPEGPITREHVAAALADELAAAMAEKGDWSLGNDLATSLTATFVIANIRKQLAAATTTTGR